MDGYRYLQPDNATRSGRRCNGIVSYDTLGDTRQPVARVPTRVCERYNGVVTLTFCFSNL